MHEIDPINITSARGTMTVFKAWDGSQWIDARPPVWTPNEDYAPAPNVRPDGTMVHPIVLPMVPLLHDGEDPAAHMSLLMEDAQLTIARRHADGK